MKVCFFVQDTYSVQKNLYRGPKIKRECADKTLSALLGTRKLQQPVCSACGKFRQSAWKTYARRYS